MIKAILMDFNGIVINDEPLQMKSYQEILKAEGIDLTEEDYYSSLGMDDETFIETAYTRAGKKFLPENVAAVKDRKTEAWRKLVGTEIPLFEGVENFVRKMEKSFALGLVSMARREEIEYVLEQTDLLSCFSVIVSAEDVSNCKPDPQCYHKGFNLLDATRIQKGHNPMVHADCLVIEDSPAGIVAGKQAGLKTWGITNTVSAEQLRVAGADVVSKTFSEWMPDTMRRVFV